MKNFKFFSFWLLLTLGATTIVFNSCSKDDDPQENINPNEPEIIAVTGISLDTSTLTLFIGEDYTLTATVTPDNAADKSVTWTSSDNTKVTVTNGKVTTIAAGTATITSQAGNQTATCAVTVRIIPEGGVLINGVVWATCNVDTPGTFAKNSETSGMFYQWNSRVGWSPTYPPISTDGSSWDNSWNGNNAAIWEKSNDPCPTGWRVPTPAEVSSLIYSDYQWTTRNGIDGVVFGSGENTIFLPAAGVAYTQNYGQDLGLFYWSNEGYGNTAHVFYSGNNHSGVGTWGANRDDGYSVRCVAE